MKKISLEKLSILVQQRRSEMDISLVDLGYKTGINRLLIGRIESKKFIPSLPQLEILLKVLEIEFNDIIEEEANEDVFVAMRGEAKTEEENSGLDRMISMMLSLRKHDVIRRKLYEQSAPVFWC